MNEAAAMLAAIRETPDEDTPRLAYADWLDEHGDADRAEFIRVQCAVARLPDDDPGRCHAEVRERQLLAKHAVEWTKPELPFQNWEYAGDEPFLAIYRRGFLDVGARLNFPPPPPYPHGWLTDADLVRLAESPDLGSQNRLSLWVRHSEGAGLTPLFASPKLARLTHLMIQGGGATPVEAMQALAHNEAARLLRVFHAGILADPGTLLALISGNVFPELHTVGFVWPYRTRNENIVEQVINSSKLPRLCVVPFSVDDHMAEWFAEVFRRCSRIAWAGGVMQDGGDGVRFSAVPENVFLPNHLDDVLPW